MSAPEAPAGPAPRAPGRRRVWLALSVGVVLAGVATWVALRRWGLPPVSAGPPGTLTVARAPSAPVIDGDPSDEVWRLASPSAPFERSDGRGPAPRPVTLRALWDDQALYIAFDGDDDALVATFEKRDEPIYTEDVFELFLDPDGDERHYYELQVSPKGVIFDALFPSYRKDLARSQRFTLAGFEARVASREGGWTAEMKIPFLSLKHAPRRPPRAGDSWRFNAFRIDLHPSGDADYMAFSPPIRPDFHALDRFGTLIFQ
jgi:hypothetical protein